MASTICHFEIPVDDVAAARKFYSELFGWSIASAPEHGEEYLFIRTSEQADALGGGILKRVEQGHGLTVYINVESIDDSLKKLEELGGTVLVAKTAVPQLGWFVTARDPQGNTIGLFQRNGGDEGPQEGEGEGEQ